MAVERRRAACAAQSAAGRCAGGRERSGAEGSHSDGGKRRSDRPRGSGEGQERGQTGCYTQRDHSVGVLLDGVNLRKARGIERRPTKARPSERSAGSIRRDRSAPVQSAYGICGGLASALSLSVCLQSSGRISSDFWDGRAGGRAGWAAPSRTSLRARPRAATKAPAARARRRPPAHPVALDWLSCGTTRVRNA